MRKPKTAREAVGTISRNREIFVYGTTLRGEACAEFLPGRRDVRDLGPARCRGKLYDLGEGPGFVPGGHDWVAGELYRAGDIEETLKRLDELESGEPFERRLLAVRWKLGEIPAWVWVWAGPVRESSRIRGGSWKAHARARRRGEAS